MPKTTPLKPALHQGADLDNLVIVIFIVFYLFVVFFSLCRLEISHQGKWHTLLPRGVEDLDDCHHSGRDGTVKVKPRFGRPRSSKDNLNPLSELGRSSQEVRAQPPASSLVLTVLSGCHPPLHPPKPPSPTPPLATQHHTRKNTNTSSSC